MFIYLQDTVVLRPGWLLTLVVNLHHTVSLIQNAFSLPHLNSFSIAIRYLFSLSPAGLVFFYEGFNFGSLNVCKRKCIKLVVRSFTVLKTSVILLCGLHILRVTFRTQPLQLTRKQHMTNKWTRHILACKLHPTVWYLIAAIRVISN